MSNPPQPPQVWLIDAYRAGESVQLRALAEALGWPFEIKTLSYRKSEFRASLSSLFRRSDLRGIKLRHSSPLTPPWPDLVISAGMRNEPVCRWIRHQAQNTALVYIGRPWANPDQFDLVITTPQYRLPEHPNILQNTLTLHRINPERLQSAAQHWQTHLDASALSLPRPYIALIVGGNSGPYTLGPKTAARLAEQASAIACQQGGALLITTSARTTVQACRELSQRITAPMHFYRWRPNDQNNPYYAYLALADAIIVTAESVSMLSEACATGKPVYLFKLDEGFSKNGDFRLSALLYKSMMRLGPQRLSRDITLIHRQVIESGHAVWLGETFPTTERPALKDMHRAVTRIHELINDNA